MEEQHIIIFGRAGCVFCDKAVALCESLGLDYVYHDINIEGITKEDLSEITGTIVTTVPQIFENTTYIGGYSEFEQKFNK